MSTDLDDSPLEAWSIDIPGRPPTANAGRSKHWTQLAAETRLYRDAAHVLARAAKIPKLEWCEIIATPRVLSRRSLPDVAACYPAVKAAIDGLVDACVLVDDTPDQVVRIVFEQPAVDPARIQSDSLLVVIRGVRA